MCNPILEMTGVRISLGAYNCTINYPMAIKSALRGRFFGFTGVSLGYFSEKWLQNREKLHTNLFGKRLADCFWGDRRRLPSPCQRPL